MFKKTALLLLVSLAVYLLIPDTNLSPGAAQWLDNDNKQIPVNDNLFNMLIGLSVAADQDPMKEGIRLVQTTNARLAEFLESADHLQTDAKPGFDPYWSNPDITVTEGVNILCEPRAQDCRNTWNSQKDTIANLIQDNAVLSSRYTELYKYPEYQTTLVADVRSPMPVFSTLMAMNRLHGAAIATRFLSGEPDPAIITLNNDIKFLRRLIRQADTIIAKMIALSMLKHDLYLYASLMDAVPEKIYLFEDIPLLSNEEKSLEKPVKYEFLMNAKLAEEIKRYPELITGELGVPAWLPFPLFRKNHSINMLHNAFYQPLLVSRLPAREYYEQQLVTKKNNEFQPGWLSYAFNPIGCILFSISMPDLDKFIIRLHDMDGLISMINLKRSIKSNNISQTDIETHMKQSVDKYFNPYTGETFNWNPAEQTLSFQGPGNEYTGNTLNLVFEETQQKAED